MGFIIKDFMKKNVMTIDEIMTVIIENYSFDDKQGLSFPVPLHSKDYFIEIYMHLN